MKPELNTKYLISHKGKQIECWYMKQGFIASSFRVIDPTEVTIIKRIGNLEELFND